MAKGKLKFKKADGNIEQLLPETTAEQVAIPSTSILAASKNVLAALEEISTNTSGNANNKVDKITSESTNTRVYAVNPDGSQTVLNTTLDANSDTIARRGTGGTLAVGTPVAAEDATTKDYVDKAVQGS